MNREPDEINASKNTVNRRCQRPTSSKVFKCRSKAGQSSVGQSFTFRATSAKKQPPFVDFDAICEAHPTEFNSNLKTDAKNFELPSLKFETTYPNYFQPSIYRPFSTPCIDFNNVKSDPWQLKSGLISRWYGLVGNLANSSSRGRSSLNAPLRICFNFTSSSAAFYPAPLSRVMSWHYDWKWVTFLNSRIRTNRQLFPLSSHNPVNESNRKLFVKTSSFSKVSSSTRNLINCI